MDDEIFSAPNILGLKSLNVPEGSLLLVQLRDAQQQTRFSVLQQRGKEWSELKHLHGPMDAQAMDAQVIEGELTIASEVNGYSPIEVSRCRISDLLDPKQSPLVLQPVGAAELSGEQAQRVVLPVSLRWNVAAGAAPRKWLFSPVFVPGEKPGTLLVNSADGQAMLVSATGMEEEASRFSHPHAFAPHAITQASSGRMLAFLRMQEGADIPYWSLSRYQGTSVPQQGALLVVERGMPERDLSQLLGLGPVFNFLLIQAHGESWIFALKDAAVGTQVAALQRGAEGWVQRGTLDFDREARLMTVAPDGLSWSVFLVVSGPYGATLHHRTWNLP